ncbi:MAG TPA: hypothetical protein VJL89_11370 [Thermodesulfovibrionia bacterium]|nr:hypothetical protein [Thermodesulfovibrionia bacterium]
MNSHIFQWPALLSKQPIESKTLSYERGIWGKVHGAVSDFRWIALSPGLNRCNNTLQMQIALGAEDRPYSSVYWKALEDSYYAIASYPSRAKDAAGRSGFLEKQIAQWKRNGSDIPAAFAALVLLPKAATFTDEIWWNQFDLENWKESDFSLPLSSSDCEPVSYSLEQLSASIEQGIEELKTLVNETDLAQFYQQILSGQKPAWLINLERPLSAHALAALILPLPRNLADSISIAGWLPSSRAEKLGERWHGICLPSNSSLLKEAMKTRSHEIQELPLRMAQALLSNNSAILSKDIPTEQKPAQDEIPDLLSPAPDAPEFLKEIFDFVQDNQRFWLDPKRLRHVCKTKKPLKPAAEQEIQKMYKWLNQVQKTLPEKEDEQQWNVKIDLLKACLLVLDPTPKTLETIGLPQTSGRIPALFFAPLLADNRQLLAFEGLSQLNEHTSACDFFKSQMQKWSTTKQAGN